MSSLFVTHPQRPQTWDEIFARGCKWFVDRNKDQFVLMFSTAQKKMGGQMYGRADLVAIDPRLPDTLTALAECGGVSEEIQTGLKHTYDFWTAADKRSLWHKSLGALFHFKEWRKLYTRADDNVLVIEAKCYQVLDRPEVAWPVVKPWLQTTTVEVDPQDMEKRFPGFLTAFEVTKLMDINKEAAARYCMEHLRLDNIAAGPVVALPQDFH